MASATQPEIDPAPAAREPSSPQTLTLVESDAKTSCNNKSNTLVLKDQDGPSPTAIEAAKGYKNKSAILAAFDQAAKSKIDSAPTAIEAAKGYQNKSAILKAFDQANQSEIDLAPVACEPSSPQVLTLIESDARTSCNSKSNMLVLDDQDGPNPAAIEAAKGYQNKSAILASFDQVTLTDNTSV